MSVIPQKGYLEQSSPPTRLLQAEECGGGQPDTKAVFNKEVGEAGGGLDGTQSILQGIPGGSVFPVVGRPLANTTRWPLVLYAPGANNRPLL